MCLLPPTTSTPAPQLDVSMFFFLFFFLEPHASFPVAGCVFILTTIKLMEMFILFDVCTICVPHFSAVSDRRLDAKRSGHEPPIFQH